MNRRLSSLTIVCVALLALISVSVWAESSRLPTATTRAEDSLPGRASGTRSADLKQVAIPLTGQAHDYDQLLALVGDARFVLLGEATHGTHEFYHERARITQRLIAEKGFAAVAIEGDWADAARVNRYVQHRSGDTGAEQALANFTRFPRWMWGNTDVRDLVEWLRAYNAGLPAATRRIGFYGLDLYNLGDSATAVVQHLERTDGQAARRARERYGCFAGLDQDPIRYGRATAMGRMPSCEVAVEEQLQELQERVASPLRQLDAHAADDEFDALQNARVVKHAEHYYRTLFTGGTNGWNLRDEHMTEMLETLAAHLGTAEQPGKVVVWAHNTHTGDARATELGERGDHNIGQLIRQRYPEQTVLVGFTTYTGTVIASREWDAPGELKQVRPALDESYSGLFHSLGLGNFLLLLSEQPLAPEMVGEPRLERAIGVIYLPETERQSHYFEARLSQQFDAVIHIDESSAVEPLQP
ncbi:MAG: erythromycin esterase [Chloroflexi bacterium]|nr:MAG: erythromycin esterase [Chloroflexota bacterium]